MQSIDWNKFKQKASAQGYSTQDFFQWMCYLLICEELGQKLGIFQYYNHPYLETEPVKGVGWQAKFYNSSTLNDKQAKKIISGMKNAKRLYPDLKEYILFLSNDLGSNNGEPAKPQKDMEEEAKRLDLNIKIRTNEIYFKSPKVVNDYEYIIS